MEKSPAVYGKIGRATAEVCQISLGKQALSWRYYCDRNVCDSDWRVHDVPRADNFLSPQPIFVQRYDMGTDVCPARIGWSWIDHAGDGARLLCSSPGEV